MNLHFMLPRLTLGFLSVLTALSTVPASAATGDLVVVCYNSDGNDEFALIALANLPVGTRYFITDSGWSTNSNNLMQEGINPSTNQQIQMDVIKAGGIPFGTVLKFSQSGANVVLTDPTMATLTMVNRFAVTGTPLLTKLSFNANLGDQILVYQTSGNTVGGTITMVSAFNGSNLTAPANPPDPAITLTDGWQVGLLPRPSQGAGNSESNLPAGLIAYNGTNSATATAFGLASFPVGGLTNQDNYKYVGSFALANKTAYLTSINNPANWAADDLNAFDLGPIGPGPSAPEINVTGNGIGIADGSITLQATDNTLFGSAPVTGGTIARTFTIQNSGTGNLTIPAGGITFTGANAADFAASGITLPAVIASAGSTNFTVTFDPTASGVRNATVTIANDDGNENPYNFAVQANGFVSVAPTGTAPPLRWSPTVQNGNFGSTRTVGSTNSGDVIAGTRITSGTTASDIRITRHVAATGAVAWTRDISNGTFDDINDMIVDPTNGDTYVCARATAGANGIDWFVVKVNGADGTTAWTYTFNGTLGTGIDECLDIGRTSDGNVVAVGSTTSTGNIVFGRVAKINVATGAQLWAYVNGSAGSQFRGVATDTSGNTYATGEITAANTNGLTAKLSSAGAQTWAVAFDGAAGLSDSFSNVVVDPGGDCVVAGTTRISATDSDVIVLKYGAAAGNEVWRRTIAGGGAGLDALHNLAVDASGNSYASGAIRSFTTTDRDAFVSKITGAGASSWIATKFGSAPDSNDRYQNVRVVGSDVYAVGDIENTNRDILVSRFNGTTGAEVWSATFNGSGNGLDDAYSDKHVMTVLGTNAIAIGGETFDVSGNTYGLVLKYAASLPPTVSNVAKTTNEDVAAAFAAANFTGSYIDPNGEPLTIVRITSLPLNGLLKLSGVNVSLNQDIPIANIGNLTYTANLNYNGGDNFNWNGSNGAFFAASTAAVNITINAVNDAPIITGQSAVFTAQDVGRAIVLGDLTVTDVDNTYPTGFTLVASNGTNYTRTGNTITPSAGFVGTLSVPVKVNDGTADSNTFNLAVTVNPTLARIISSSRIVPEPGGGFRVSFLANPGVNYAIQHSTTLLPGDWLPLGTATAGPDGNFSIVDIPPGGAPRRFYRAVIPQ